MAKRKVTRKTERGNIIVNVRVGGETKKPKKRRSRRPRPSVGVGGISPIGRTGVEYLPPYVTRAAPSQVLDAVNPLRNQAISGLLEDVKTERAGLLKDIEKQTESQIIRAISKAQGAEQRGALAQIGFIDPTDTSQYAKPLGDIATAAQPPSLTQMMKPSQPTIAEIDELPYKDYPEEPARQAAEQKRKKLKIVKKLDKNDQPPEPIKEKPIEQSIQEEKPVETVKEAVDKIERTKGVKFDQYFKSGSFYEEKLKPLGFPRAKGDVPNWKEQVISLYDIAKSRGMIKRGGDVSETSIEQYYGGEKAKSASIFGTRAGAGKQKDRPVIQVMEEPPSLIPVRDIESEPLTEYRKKQFNLGKQA
jgi:hypothetical protein